MYQVIMKRDSLTTLNSVMGILCIVSSEEYIPDAARKKELVNKTEEIQECFMTAFEGTDVKKHCMENVAGCSKLMDRHMLRGFFTK